MVRIPIEDGGWIELSDDDPRAVAYVKRFPTAVPRAVAPRPKLPRQARRGIYTVQAGDTLSAIAQDLLSDWRQAPALAELNHLANQNLLLVGQHLVIPDAAASSPSTRSSASPGAQPAAGSAPATPSASLALGRGFLFVFFEQLPEVGAASRIIRKVAVVPRDYAFPFPRLGPNAGIPRGVGKIAPRDPFGILSPVEHVLNTNPAGSPFLSASDRAFASGSIEGTPLLIDVAKVRAAGGQVLTVEELVAELTAHANANPVSRGHMDRLIWTVSKVEGEVLVRGGVPRGAATVIKGPAHLASIRSAEGLWAGFKAGELTQAELGAGLANLERSYARMRVFGRVGRVFTVVGLVLTAYDLERAGERSVQQRSVKPIGAEVIRQIGGWAGAAAGAKIGAVAGAALGIETGPGALVTGALGALVFGGLGYFGADLLADQIAPN